MIFQSLQEKIRPASDIEEKTDWAIEAEKEYVAEQKKTERMIRKYIIIPVSAVLSLMSCGGSVHGPVFAKADGTGFGPEYGFESGLSENQ